mmetsp:Transcript_1800/g.4002  ORF Transcript_1800/g.4002 Transcript_1800/m.4002 type:complete len:437 (-) Transcript_1800:2866-4176(-)
MHAFIFILVVIIFITSETNGFVSAPKKGCSSVNPLFGYKQVGDYLSSLDSEPDEKGERNEGEHGEYIGLSRVGGNGVEEEKGYEAPSSFQNYEINAPPTETPEPSSPEEIIALNNARLCPKNLLTQRAIQSFIFLCEECRDPHSGVFIEEFLGVKNLGNYHGSAAFNLTKYPMWDSVLYDLMRQPNTKIIVSAKRRGRGHGGWSKNNPYLQERWVEFPIDIRPASLVQRLLPVRAQLASEFQRDLEIVTQIGDEELIFERASLGTLSNFTAIGSSSPLRRGNFDLLYSLCTQAATHALLRELQTSREQDEVAFVWMKEFYSRSIQRYFDGDQPIGQADAFLDKLLSSPPSFVEHGDGNVGLSDPLLMAQRIIQLRRIISQDWIQQMAEVEEDHTHLNAVLIRVMMGRMIDSSGNDFVDIQEESTTDDLSSSIGEFE